MKPCDRVDSLLSAFLEHETSPAETRFVDGHMTACARCRAQVDGMRTTLRHLSELPRVEVSPDFTRKLLARTAGLPPAGLEVGSVVELRPARPAWVMPLAAAAVLALAIVGVLRVQRGPGPSQQTAAVEPAGQAGPLEGVAGQAPAEDPATASTENVIPEIESLPGPGEATPLGLGSESYLVEEYELRTPAGGGEPVLTRVSADKNTKVVVTF